MVSPPSYEYGIGLAPHDVELNQSGLSNAGLRVTNGFEQSIGVVTSLFFSYICATTEAVIYTLNSQAGSSEQQQAAAGSSRQQSV